MTKQFEEEVLEKTKQGETIDKLDIPIAKFFWQAGLFGNSSNDNIPKFLKEIIVLKNFSDNELRIFSKYLHLRSFSNGEIIFRQGNLGIGFYFILSGQVDITVESNLNLDLDGFLDKEKLVLTLERFDYFGELALLQENSIRNASAYAKENCLLLGFFKPDLDEIIEEYPIVATKLLQSVSMIIANRLLSVTNEVRKLKNRIAKLEGKNVEVKGR